MAGLKRSEKLAEIQLRLAEETRNKSDNEQKPNLQLGRDKFRYWSRRANE